jgi:hypothetical protein
MSPIVGGFKRGIELAPKGPYFREYCDVRAKECKRMAERATNAEKKADFLDLAQMWRKAAETPSISMTLRQCGRPSMTLEGLRQRVATLSQQVKAEREYIAEALKSVATLSQQVDARCEHLAEALRSMDHKPAVR